VYLLLSVTRKAWMCYPFGEWTETRGWWAERGLATIRACWNIPVSLFLGAQKSPKIMAPSSLIPPSPFKNMSTFRGTTQGETVGGG
jgi:hypothetical protein